MQTQHGRVLTWKPVDTDFVLREIHKYLEYNSKSIDLYMLKSYNYIMKIEHTGSTKRYYK